MKVRLIEDYGNIPSGSTIEVTRKTRDKYHGIWRSMIGTHWVSIPKTKCITIDND